jgi:hypothetical protein
MVVQGDEQMAKTRTTSKKPGSTDEQILARIYKLAAQLPDRYSRNRVRQAIQDIRDRRGGKDF